MNKDNYGWLYDRSGQNCEITGCYNNIENYSSTVYGYWTPTVGASSGNHYIVVRTGHIQSASDACDQYGIRPVITVTKSLIQ